MLGDALCPPGRAVPDGCPSHRSDDHQASMDADANRQTDACVMYQAHIQSKGRDTSHPRCRYGARRSCHTSPCRE
jgi:hypothetical protein